MGEPGMILAEGGFSGGPGAQLKQLVNTYLFVSIPDPEETGQALFSIAERESLKGTLLIAAEGFNIALWGEAASISRFLSVLDEEFPMENAQTRRLGEKEQPFGRLRLKVKAEIITFGRSAPAELNEGTFVEPDQVASWIADPNVVLLDTRNAYETVVGTFQGATTLPIHSFTELAANVPELAQRFRGKKVLGFCTGGVRCEKAVPFLRANGLEAFQIRGGILGYLDRFPQGAWEGECFVFDDRYSIRADGSRGSFSACVKCGQPARTGRCLVCGETASSMDEARA